MPQPHPVEMHIQIVWSSVRLVLLQRVLYELLPNTRVDLWRVMQGASLDYGLIEWCKIFGNRSDDTHWTKLVPNDRHDAFREGLLAAVGYDGDRPEIALCWPAGARIEQVVAQGAALSPVAMSDARSGDSSMMQWERPVLFLPRYGDGPLILVRRY